MIKQFFFKQFYLASVICFHTSERPIWPIDRTLLGATIPSQSEPGSNINEGVLHIPWSSKTGASLSDGTMLHPGHLLGATYPFAKIQSVYSTSSAY